MSEHNSKRKLREELILGAKNHFKFSDGKIDVEYDLDHLIELVSMYFKNIVEEKYGQR